MKPSANHPITIQLNPARVLVMVGDQVIADTKKALTLREASYGDVQYIPRADVRMDLLERTDNETYCPFKGEASYFSIPAGGQATVNSVWIYENPHEAVSKIKDYVAFYPNKVKLQEVRA